MLSSHEDVRDGSLSCHRLKCVLNRVTVRDLIELYTPEEDSFLLETLLGLVAMRAPALGINHNFVGGDFSIDI